MRRASKGQPGSTKPVRARMFMGPSLIRRTQTGNPRLSYNSHSDRLPQHGVKSRVSRLRRLGVWQRGARLMGRSLTILLGATLLSFFTGCIPAEQPTLVAPSPTSAPPPSSTQTSQPTPTALAPIQTRFEDQGRVLYLDSGAVRLGIDTEWGGAIREIWFNGENVINNYDGGRLLAVSFYDSDRPPASNHPNDTGWNPPHQTCTTMSTLPSSTPSPTMSSTPRHATYSGSPTTREGARPPRANRCLR